MNHSASNPQAHPRTASVVRRALASASGGAVLLALVVGFSGGSTGCGPTAPHATAADLLNLDDDTSLGTGDVFEVRVYGEEDLSADYRVAQDGGIDFPLIGRVEVAGLEPPEVAEAIATRLRDGQFLVAPHVSVVVREVNSKRISVLGAVRNPGTYPMRSGMGVVEAIGLAGGFTALGNRNGTVITRRTGDDLRRISAPVDQITNGNEIDIPIRSGDIISVPERIF